MREDRGIFLMATGLNLLRRNLISNAVGIVVPALSWVVVVPVLVRCLGVDGFGVYTIAFSLSGLMSFLELGLTSASIKFIADVEIRRSDETLEKIVSSNIFLYAGIGVFVVILTFLFATQLAALIFRETNVDADELALIVKFVGILVSMTLVKNSLASVVMGFQRYDIYNLIQVNFFILQAFSLVAASVIWKNIPSLMLANIGVMAVSIIGFIIAIRRLSPRTRLVRTPHAESLKILFSFGMYMMLINLSSTVLMNMDKVIVGWVMGPESVAYYSVPAQIALKIHNGLAVLIMFIFPLTSEVQSCGDESTVRQIYLHSMRFIVLADGVAMVFLSTFASDILKIWIDTNFSMASAHLLVLTSLAYLAFSLSITPFHMLQGIGRARELSLMCMATSFSVIACLYLGIDRFGLVGGCSGVIIGMATTIALPWYVQRILGITWAEAFNESYGRTLLCSVIGIAVGPIIPAKFVLRTIFYSAFIIFILVFGNTTKHDWSTIKVVLKKAVAGVGTSINLE
jgi:O-antigen/teichoic acid export membrane protein